MTLNWNHWFTLRKGNLHGTRAPLRGAAGMTVTYWQGVTRWLPCRRLEMLMTRLGLNSCADLSINYSMNARHVGVCLLQRYGFSQ